MPRRLACALMLAALTVTGQLADTGCPRVGAVPGRSLAGQISPDAIFAVIGTPRTKCGFLDGWLVRGTYHVVNGTFKDGTGTLVAGGNQFSRSWAKGLTPNVASRIAEWIPGFPVKMEDSGGQQSSNWGTNSYGSTYQKGMLFQPASSYCEVCHTFKFDFNSRDELLALGARDIAAGGAPGIGMGTK